MKVSSYQGIFVKSSDSRSECEHTLPVVPFWKHKECIFHTSEALFSKKQKVKLLHTFIGFELAFPHGHISMLQQITVMWKYVPVSFFI